MIDIVDQIDGQWEYDYFKSIVDNIDIDNNISFVFMKWDDDIPKTKYPAVLFVTSDEHHRFQKKFVENPNVLLTFKNYYMLNFVHEKIKPFPLGYLQGFEASNKIPILDREYDYSFSGTLPAPPCEPTRHNLEHSLKKLSTDKRKKFVLFYEGWAKGLSMKKYSDVMENTKIALCPSGYTSSETFRYFEAAKAGCVLISEKKPDVWHYENAPHLTIDCWTKLPIFLELLLSKPKLLEDLAKKTVNWWNAKCAPNSVAAYVAKSIKEAAYD